VVNYKEYTKLSAEESDMVLILARALRPTLFINKCFFENEKMCNNSSNKFYKIEEVEKSMAVTNDVIVKGERTFISKVMYYKSSYMEKHYYGPMEKLEFRLCQIDKGLHRCVAVVYNFDTSAINKTSTILGFQKYDIIYMYKMQHL
jgi:hypothetical protein